MNLTKYLRQQFQKAIEEIRTAPVLHDTVCETAAMEDEVKKILGILMNHKKQPMEENGLLFLYENVMINQDRE